ncbi:MAG: CcdB family protein [Acetobacteraceae bacterium]|nr:CcdB family protein [Acetobacteraceae bacterium]
MPRFDLYRRRGGPGYLLDVQSEHLYLLPTRVVVPLLPPSPDLPAIRDLNPTLHVGDEALAMMPQYLTAVPKRELGRSLGNLLDQSDDITRALSILLTGF